VLRLGAGAVILEDIKSLRVKLEDGSELGIMPGHTPLIAATGDGLLRYTTSDGKQELNVKGGIMTIKKNVVSILTTH